MKRFSPLIIILFIGFGAPWAGGQTWHPANQVTLAWDPVMTLAGGEPIPAGQTVTYTVFIKAGSPDGAAIEGATISATQAVVTFPVPGRYYLGIRANLMEGPEKIAESQVAWSYDAAACQNGRTFGVIFSRPPEKPMNLRIPTN